MAPEFAPFPEDPAHLIVFLLHHGLNSQLQVVRLLWTPIGHRAVKLRTKPAQLPRSETGRRDPRRCLEASRVRIGSSDENHEARYANSEATKKEAGTLSILNFQQRDGEFLRRILLP